MEQKKNKPAGLTAENIQIALMQFLDRGGKLIESEDNVLPYKCYENQVKSNSKRG